MSLKPTPIEPVPEQTAQIARAAFPTGNAYLKLRDELGTLYGDEDFAQLFPRRGQPALPPWRLALVTILQFRENLSDRQAAQAVRARIDWKYLLGLELSDPGFNFSVLCKFRARLIAGSAGMQLLETMLGQFRAHGLLKAGARQRTDSTHVLASTRTLGRLELVGETLRAALNEIACCRRPKFDHLKAGWSIFNRRQHFSDTVAGAQASANLYSLLQTCVANGVDGYCHRRMNTPHLAG